MDVDSSSESEGNETDLESLTGKPGECVIDEEDFVNYCLTRTIHKRTTGKDLNKIPLRFLKKVKDGKTRGESSYEQQKSAKRSPAESKTSPPTKKLKTEKTTDHDRKNEDHHDRKNR